MANKVIITKSKIDTLANSISIKSGVATPMTLAQMKTAVDSITVGQGIIPVGTLDIIQNGTYNVTNYVSAEVNVPKSSTTISLQSKTVSPSQSEQNITADSDYDGLSSVQINAISSTYIGSGVTQKSAQTYTPTENQQTIASGQYLVGIQTINAIPNNYIGSSIDRRNDTDLSVLDNTITVPAGYYETSVNKSVASGSAGTPIATKGTISNHAISVTPSVTNTTGYIAGGTETGTAVSVAASELVSGTLTISSSGTKDVTNYASASVAAGTVTAPSSISGTSASVSTGTNTLTLSKTVSVTPSVTTVGYVSSGTAGNTAVSLTANVTTKAATTINTSTTDQTIASGTYLTGTQTIKAVTYSGLSPSNIANGVTVKIGDTNDDDRIASITGTLAFSTIYTGSSAPSSSQGVNGDIYIQS